jgi:hypothetical protein
MAKKSESESRKEQATRARQSGDEGGNPPEPTAAESAEEKFRDLRSRLRLQCPQIGPPVSESPPA